MVVTVKILLKCRENLEGIGEMSTFALAFEKQGLQRQTDRRYNAGNSRSVRRSNLKKG